MSIEIYQLTKRYGKKTALNNVNLNIGEGMFGLLGPNGAGKTTLMRIIAALLPPTNGSVTIKGIAVSNRSKIHTMIGYLPQDFNFYPQLSVYEALDYLAVLGGIDNQKQRRLRIRHLLHQVNLWQHRKIKVRALSGGMRRRLGIAQALLNDPQVLIVDEPTAGLDPEERVRFRNLLSEFAIGRTVILSTHIVGDVEFACDRLAILNQGQIVYQGRVQDLLARTQGLVWTYVARDNSELQQLKNRYRVVSHVNQPDGLQVRLLAREITLSQARPAEPTVEDAYMALMGGLLQ